MQLDPTHSFSKRFNKKMTEKIWFDRIGVVRIGSCQSRMWNFSEGWFRRLCEGQGSVGESKMCPLLPKRCLWWNAKRSCLQQKSNTQHFMSICFPADASICLCLCPPLANVAVSSFHLPLPTQKICCLNPFLVFFGENEGKCVQTFLRFRVV